MYLLLLLSVCFAALAAVLVWHRLGAVLSGGVAEGVVVEHDRREIDDSIGFYPVVSFLDHDGKHQRFTSRAGWNTRRPAVGSTVRVRYLRSNPKVAYIQSFLHLWAAPVALVALAAAALAFAVDVSTKS